MEEAKIRVRLDTAGATAQLKSLVQDASQTAGRVGAGVRSALGKGVGAIGLGGLGGQALGAIRAPTEASSSDIISESFGGIATWLERQIYGDLGPEARASRRAREAVRDTFAYQADILGKTPPAATAQYNSLMEIMRREERGKQIIDRDLRSVAPGDLAQQMGYAIGEGFRWLSETLYSPYDSDPRAFGPRGR